MTQTLMMPATTSCLMLFTFLTVLQTQEVYGNATGRPAQPIESMRRLRQMMLGNYSCQIRPVTDNLDPVVLNVTLEYCLLLGVRNVEQEIQSMFTLVFFWHDHFLQWNPDDYNGIDHFSTTANDIWVPEVRITNAKDSNRYLTNAETYVTIRHDGRIYWTPIHLTTTTCGLDMTYFPFNVQTCEIRIFFSQTAEEMVLLLENVLRRNAFQENGEWKIMGVSGEVIERELGGLKFSPLFLYVPIKRRWFFYVMTLIFPMLILSVLSSSAFLVSGASCEKLTFALTVLLSQVVLYSFASTLLPTTSDEVPLIIIYVFALLLHNTVCVLAIVYSINTFTKTTPDVKHLGSGLRMVCKITSIQWYKTFLVPSTTSREANTVLYVADKGEIGSQEVNKSGELKHGLVGKASTEDPVQEEAPEVWESPKSWIEVSQALDRFFLLLFWLSNVLINLSFFLSVGLCGSLQY